MWMLICCLWADMTYLLSAGCHKSGHKTTVQNARHAGNVNTSTADYTDRCVLYVIILLRAKGVVFAVRHATTRGHGLQKRSTAAWCHWLCPSVTGAAEQPSLTCSPEELPTRIGVRLGGDFMRSTARSLSGSAPRSSASKLRLSTSVTLMLVESLITCTAALPASNSRLQQRQHAHAGTACPPPAAPSSCVQGHGSAVHAACTDRRTASQSLISPTSEANTRQPPHKSSSSCSQHQRPHNRPFFDKSRQGQVTKPSQVLTW